jgi:hypothetical protein
MRLEENLGAAAGTPPLSALQKLFAGGPLSVKSSETKGVEFIRVGLVGVG